VDYWPQLKLEGPKPALWDGSRKVDLDATPTAAQLPHHDPVPGLAGHGQTLGRFELELDAVPVLA
jgi:hypothetical protein